MRNPVPAASQCIAGKTTAPGVPRTHHDKARRTPRTPRAAESGSSGRPAKRDGTSRQVRRIRPPTEKASHGASGRNPSQRLGGGPLREMSRDVPSASAGEFGGRLQTKKEDLL